MGTPPLNADKGVQTTSSPEWLIGGGAMGDLVRAMDWSSTPLGPRAAWPAWLRSAVNLVLAGGFPMAILWGDELRFIYNDAYRVIASERHPAAMGCSTREVWPEVWTFNEPIFTRIMTHGDTVTLEDQPFVITRAGQPEEAYFTLSYSPIYTNHGRIGGVLVTLLETTQRIIAERQHAEDEARRQRMEATLRAREEQLREVLDHALSASYKRDLRTGTFEYISPVNLQISGYTPEEMLTWTFEDFSNAVHPDDLHAHAEIMHELQVGTLRPSYQLTYRFKHKNGQYHWVFDQFTIQRDAKQQLLSVIGSVSDITAQKRAEEALQSEHAFLRTALDMLPLPLSFVDDQRQEILVNRAAHDYLRARGITCRQDTQLLDPQTRRTIPYHDWPSMRALRGEVVVAEEHLVHVIATGEEIPCLLYAMPVVVDGRIIAAGVLLHDITALKQADRAKDEFLAMLSHELQTPLTSMLGWSAEALRKGTPEMMAEAMEIVQRNAVRQQRLVEEILDISRLTHRKITLHCERTELGEEAALAVENIRPTAAERGITLVLEPCDTRLPIDADPVRLQQCLGNLLQNSLKFTPKGGAVTVRCRREGVNARVSVTDTGRGIAPDAVPRLFEVFHQVNRDEHTGGLGLGLAITHGIIALHDGQLTAESPGLGHGSTFTISLPLAQERGEVSAAPSS